MTEIPVFTPYISFPGNAAEALEYYRETFGGTLDVMTYDDFPDTSGFPFTPPPGAVAHAQLHGGAVTLAGGDDIGEHVVAGPVESDHYSFIVQPTEEQVARDLIDKLTATGGVVTLPFELAPWGWLYGQVTDKYGVLWQFSVDARTPQS